MLVWRVEFEISRRAAPPVTFAFGRLALAASNQSIFVRKVVRSREAHTPRILFRLREKSSVKNRQSDESVAAVNCDHRPLVCAEWQVPARQRENISRPFECPIGVENHVPFYRSGYVLIVIQNGG